MDEEVGRERPLDWPKLLTSAITDVLTSFQNTGYDCDMACMSRTERVVHSELHSEAPCTLTELNKFLGKEFCIQLDLIHLIQQIH